MFATAREVKVVFVRSFVFAVGVVGGNLYSLARDGEPVFPLFRRHRLAVQELCCAGRPAHWPFRWAT